MKQRVPSVEELIAARDYQGAITVLRFKRQGNRGDVKWAEWLAYAYFHHGEHDKVQRLNVHAAADQGTEFLARCTKHAAQQQQLLASPSYLLAPALSVCQALAIYQELLHQEDPDPMYHTYCAACHYYMGLTSEAEEAVQKVQLVGQ